MAEPEKLFTCVRSGINHKINPRNAAGWRALGLWMAGYSILLALFVLGTIQPFSSAVKGGFLALFLLATGVWLVTMVRWMMARSEMIDVDELLKLKRELDQQKKRR